MGFTEEPALQILTPFLKLKGRLESYAVLLAVAVVGGAMLANAWRNAVVAHWDCLKTSFPPEYVVTFGFYGTLIVALSAGPAYLALQRVGHQIRDSVSPLKTGDPLPKWSNDRKNLDELLGVGLTSSGGMKILLSILAPLLSGIVSTVGVGK